MKKYILVILLFAAVAYGCHQTEAEPANETSGTTATPATPAVATVVVPAFNIMDIKGKPFNLADFKGKKIFVNLWASWCPPCRAEIPSIEKLYGKVDKNKVAFVMISLDDEFTTAVSFTTKNKLTVPVYFPAEKLPLLFNVDGIPATFIFDEKGNLIDRIDGGDDYEAEKYVSLLSK
ncbi:MAG: TlpA disulfide reductase family protein [Ferruginibacter sp.]